MAIRMHMRTRGRHIMVPEISQMTNFQARFFYNTFLSSLTNLPIVVTLFYLIWWKISHKRTCLLEYAPFMLEW